MISLLVVYDIITIRIYNVSGGYMKKKLLPIILGVAVLSGGAAAFTACGGDKVAYTVTFDANGGVFAENEKTVNGSVDENTSAKQPEVPERSGYELLGWATDEDGKEMWDFRAYSVYENTTLYAVWVKVYTVTLNANGGNVLVDGSSKSSVTQTVRADSLINVDYDITKSNAILVGWTTDAAGEKLWNIEEDEVTENVTLYAVWKNKYSVTFNAGEDGMFPNGKRSVKVEVAEGESVERVEVPEREGYDFIGWSNNGVAWSKDDTVTGNLDLTALWQLSDNAQLPGLTVTRNGNTYSWKAIKGAERYSVVVTHFNAETEKTETYKENLTATSWTFPSSFPEDEITLTEGDSYYVTVIAHGDGKKTLSSSASITYAYRVLDKISRLGFNTTTGEVYWGAVANASGYDVIIDGDEENILRFYENSFSLKGYSVGIHHISVVPYSSGYVKPAATTLTVTNKILPAPKNFETGSEIGYVRLGWDEVEGADSYIVNIGGKSFTAENNYYDFEDETLFTNGAAKVTVQSFNSDGFYLVSDNSPEKTVKFLYSLSVSRDDGKWCDYTVKKTDKYGDLYVPDTYTVTLSGIRWDKNDSVTYQRILSVSSAEPLIYQYEESTNNYVFVGWYEDSDYKKLYDFTQPIEGDLTLYAKYYYTGHQTLAPYDFFRLGCTSAKKTIAMVFDFSFEYRYFSVFADGEYTLNFTSENADKYLTVENITKNKSYTGYTAFTGNSCSYTFKADAGDVIRFGIHKIGGGAVSTPERIEVYLEGAVPEDGGRASGYKAIGNNAETAVHNTLSSYGTELSVTAADRDGETFVGWYIGENCVSTEKTYSFTVNGDIALVARYEKE